MKMPLMDSIDFLEIFKYLKQTAWGVILLFIIILSYLYHKFFKDTVNTFYEAKKSEYEAKKMDYETLQKQMELFKDDCNKSMREIEDRFNQRINELNEMLSNERVQKSNIIGIMQGLEINLRNIGIDIKPYLDEFKNG